MYHSGLRPPTTLKIMPSFPVFQVVEGQWKSSKMVDICGVKIPAYFTRDPRLLEEYITTFQARRDDVFLASYPRSGTTWIMEIVWQIYHEGTTNSRKVEDRCPFLEEATKEKASPAKIDNLSSPRLLKTHLPYDIIPKSEDENLKCKYIYIARNPKDAAVSLFEFLTSLAADFEYNGPWEFFYKLFIEGNVSWNFWTDHVLGWWKHRDDPNVLFLKYEDLHKDLLSNVHKITKFLDKPLSDDLIKRIAEQCAFNGMMKNAPSYWLRGTEDGPKLLRKGVVGDWKSYFTPEQSERFEKEVLAKLEGTGLQFEH